MFWFNDEDKVLNRRAARRGLKRLSEMLILLCRVNVLNMIIIICAQINCGIKNFMGDHTDIVCVASSRMRVMTTRNIIQQTCSYHLQVVGFATHAPLRDKSLNMMTLTSEYQLFPDKSLSM